MLEGLYLSIGIWLIFLNVPLNGPIFSKNDDMKRSDTFLPEKRRS